MDKNETPKKQFSIMAVIPARSGSKGVPHKNLCQIAGSSLIAHAVKTGMNSRLIADTFISTDSPEYENAALELGAKSMGLRPEELSTNTAKSHDAVIHLIEQLKAQGKEYDYVLLLQPTAPQRRIDEIPALLETLETSNSDAAVSVSKIDEPHPVKLKTIDDNGCLHPFIDGSSSEQSRQGLSPVYQLTGAYYLIKTQTLCTEKTFFPKGRTAAFITAPIVNIDTQDDIDYLNYLVETGKVTLEN